MAVRTVREPHQRQVLALTTTPGFASLWLIPRLTAFTRAHPGIDVRLDAGLNNRNLASEGFDLAMRYSPVGAAQGRQLFAESTVPVCSPQLAGELGLPLREPADLARHTLLHLGMDGDRLIVDPAARQRSAVKAFERWLLAQCGDGPPAAAAP
ncbi:MAG: LysR substrate-binding domain-containing protein [Roseateles sp.]